jgi:hypothetical protein
MSDLSLMLAPPLRQGAFLCRDAALSADGAVTRCHSASNWWGDEIGSGESGDENRNPGKSGDRETSVRSDRHPRPSL